MRLAPLAPLHGLVIDVRHGRALCGTMHPISVVERSVVAGVLFALRQILVHEGVVHSSVPVHRS